MNSRLSFVLLHYFGFCAGVVNFFNYVQYLLNIYGDQHLLRHRYNVVNNRMKCDINNK